MPTLTVRMFLVELLNSAKYGQLHHLADCRKLLQMHGEQKVSLYVM